VAIYAFSIVAASLYAGAYVLSFFGISIPVLRVAGGIIVAASGGPSGACFATCPRRMYRVPKSND
jgi:hypothetical protein